MKMFYIHNCRHCPNGSIIVDAVRCKMEERIVYNASKNGIPDWCPLPDATNENIEDFERELQETKPPTAAARAYPLSMIL